MFHLEAEQSADEASISSGASNVDEDPSTSDDEFIDNSLQVSDEEGLHR